MSGVSFHQSWPWLPCTRTVPSVSRNGTIAPSGGWCLRDVNVCASEMLQIANQSVITARNSFFVKTDLRLKVAIDCRNMSDLGDPRFGGTCIDRRRIQGLADLLEANVRGTTSGNRVPRFCFTARLHVNRFGMRR